MESALQSVCLGCAKYESADRTGRLLAGACLAPYFVVYHAAVRLHARRCGWCRPWRS